MKILFFDKRNNLDKIDANKITPKFSSTKRNLEYCIGRFLVKLGAKKFLKIDNFIIDETSEKPKIKDNLFYFSISHSFDYICVAFSDTELGFDIEKIRNKDYKKIAQRMNFKCDDLEDFFKCWTQYEAKYKSKINNAKNFRFKDYMCAISADNIDTVEMYNVKITENNFDFCSELFDNVCIEKIKKKGN